MTEVMIKRKGSNRHKQYGDAAAAQRKIIEKFPKDLEGQCRDWLEKMLGERIAWGEETSLSKPGDAFADALDDGVVLCRIMNEVRPGTIPKIHGEKGANVNVFKMQENIANFLNACQEEPFNCNPQDLFQTVYLFERQNLGQVISGIQAFARKAHAFDQTVPLFGPKEAEKNPRNFPEQPKCYRGDI
ncbi:calponin-1 isoform X2 [Nematostella vectensis]|uniref:calponin-1 isoform X2 n=1 Tax=Nematostella vectensis TaxID=45351 RepID=UPI00138F9D7C|nr:calponin-1 isoform X2 [Nematostella vectensis]